MKSSIVRRLVISFVAITALVLIVSAGLNRWSFEQGFRSYLAERDSELLRELAPALESHYAENDGWQRLASEPRVWRRLIRQARSTTDIETPSPGPPDRSRRERGREGLLLRLALLDASGKQIAGRAPVDMSATRIALQVESSQVGSLLLRPIDFRRPGTEARFTGRQLTSTLLIAGLALLIASFGAYLIGRALRMRVKALTRGAQAITAGDFETRLPATSSDELGELAARFNTLAQTLQANRSARRQWVSDIAHELRTPLTILSGELQALEDGIRPLDLKAIRSLQNETQRLSLLVNDLRLLALSDEGALTYAFTPVNLNNLIEGSVSQWQDTASDANLKLTWTPLPAYEQAWMSADANRLGQLLDNLLSNSCAHTDAPGHISVALERLNDELILLIDDSVPDAPSGSHERIFERLYRPDESRARQSSDGSGLGLSICRAIVEGHHGTISASTSPLGGLRVRVTLPASKSSERRYE